MDIRYFDVGYGRSEVLPFAKLAEDTESCLWDNAYIEFLSPLEYFEPEKVLNSNGQKKEVRDTLHLVSSYQENGSLNENAVMLVNVRSGTMEGNGNNFLEMYFKEESLDPNTEITGKDFKGGRKFLVSFYEVPGGNAHGSMPPVKEIVLLAPDPSSHNVGRMGVEAYVSFDKEEQDITEHFQAEALGSAPAFKGFFEKFKPEINAKLDACNENSGGKEIPRSKAVTNFLFYNSQAMQGPRPHLVPFADINLSARSHKPVSFNDESKRSVITKEKPSK
ncbi:MAG: hypothetical protein ACTSXQ_02660 [Alphaproteobacteria bacterium]